VYMISFWLPTLIKEMGVSNPLHVGLLAAIPYSITTVGMIAIGIHSDRTLERRWHCAIPAFIGALALIGLVYSSGNMVLSFVLLSLASLGIITTMPLFWSIPTGYLKGAAAAGGIAFINSLGLIGGFMSPFVLGWIKTSTGSLEWGNWLMAGVMAAGGLVILLAVRPGMLRETQVTDR
jgi:MFS family permease